jgi:hypothetical protein
MVTHETLQLADDVGVPAELQIGFDPFLARDEPHLLQASDLCLGEVVEGELGECRAAPQLERVAQTLSPFVRRQPAHIGEGSLEPARVDLLGADAEHVAGRARLEHVCAERAPQASDRVLQRGSRGLRRLLAPQEID